MSGGIVTLVLSAVDDVERVVLGEGEDCEGKKKKEV